MMKIELAYRVALFISGVINFIPSVLVFFPNKISKAYGITLPDANFELIIRHRAVLFGIVGGLMIFSAFTKKFYTISTVAGMISLGSFLLLYALIDGPINSELRKVMLVDVFATVVLGVGVALFMLRK